jgi:peptidoglycan/xylan/chitin deacetylase (PgdA/CDA1 family)
VTLGRTVRDRLRGRPPGPALPTVAVLALIGAVMAGAGDGPQPGAPSSARNVASATRSAAGHGSAAASPAAQDPWDQALARGLPSSAPQGVGSPGSGTATGTITGGTITGDSGAGGSGAATPGGGPASSGPPTGSPEPVLAPPDPPLACPKVTPGYLDQTPPTFRRTVALTFDDGPGPWTPKFLAVLAKYHVHGTFFMVASRAQPRPDLVADVVNAGNLVGNHTWSHPLHPGLSQLPAARVTQEIGSAQTLLTTLSGSAPCFFRGPGEDHRNAFVQGLAHAYGLTVTDTTRTAADSGNPRNAVYDPAWRDLIVTRLTAAGDHPIVLMHDGHNDNKVNELSALEQIIVWYKSRGYAFTDPAGRLFPAAG